MTEHVRKEMKRRREQHARDNRSEGRPADDRKDRPSSSRDHLSPLVHRKRARGVFPHRRAV